MAYPAERQMRISPINVVNFTEWISLCLSFSYMHENGFAKIATLLGTVAHGFAFQKGAYQHFVRMKLLQYVEVHQCICNLETHKCLQCWKSILRVVVDALNDHRRLKHFACWPIFQILLHSHISRHLQGRP